MLVHKRNYFCESREVEEYTVSKGFKICSILTVNFKILSFRDKFVSSIDALI